MSTNTLSSPPSSFRNNVPLSGSSAVEPSSSTRSKSKRQSMHAGSSSSSGSAGPRPLHLALGSVVSAASPALQVSPSTSSQDAAIPNESTEASAGEIPSAKRDSVQSAASSSRGQSPLLPLSPNVASLRKDSAARKRSSISYIPSTPNSPSYLQTNRHDSLEGYNFVPSPLSGSRTGFLADGAGMSAGLARTSSLGRKGSRTPRSGTFNERASTGSMLANSDSNVANAMAHLKERPPLTLNEKHADLLHFIAQKESKCLELRSQLAVHEAELLQLKRKWEKIVNRGFEKALSPNTASSTSFSPSSAPSIYPPESTSPGNGSAGYFPTLNANNTNAPATVVLEGIKESMQGVSRLIAAGLGSIAQVNAAPDSGASHSNANANAPLPLRLGAVSQRRPNDSGHGQTESQSSSSTTMSAASNMSSSSFLSISTTSSATSAGSSASLTDSTNTTKRSTSASDADAEETESEFGEFARAQASLGLGTRERSATLTEQLIVQDTGATPMMSPNPHFQRRKVRIDDPSSSSVSPSASSNANAGGGSTFLLSDSHHETDSSSKEDFDWDDGWDEPASEAQMQDQDQFGSSKSNLATPKKTSVYAPTSAMDATQSRARGSGLAILGTAVEGTGASSTPATQQTSSWVGSVGKRWGEIKGSSTFTKNQKRASVLLSDIQQTFVSSLISQTPTSDSSFSTSAYPTPNTPSSYSALSPNMSHTHTPATPSSKAFGSSNINTSRNALARPSSYRRGVSLIDDSDDESFGESADDGIKSNATMPLAARMMSASVMVPDSVPRTLKAKEVSNAGSKTGGTDTTDDDEWNW